MLAGFDGVLLPGGFSLRGLPSLRSHRTFSNIMAEVIRFAEEGKPVFGTCNGFQILTEAGLLPGFYAEMNRCTLFAKPVQLQVNNQTPFTSEYQQDERITIPVAHGEGNYYCDDQTYQELEANNQIVFRYVDNVNGSLHGIAGICNKAGNVLGDDAPS